MSFLPVLFFDRPLPDAYRDLLDGRADVVGPDEDDLALADGVIASVIRHWDASALASAPRVKVVSRSGIGYDNLDVPSLTSAGVASCFAPDAPTVSTAEQAIALMLAITKEIPGQANRAAEGLGPLPVPTALELDGRVLGLVGCGRIARRVATTGLALGMRVIVHDPYVDVAPVAGVTMVALADIWERSDVISLHAPSSPATRHMINESTLAALRLGAYLVNTARGSLVDQDALLAALNSAHLAGAALDVTEPEPLPIGHPLLAHPRCIVTPHVASSTTAARRRLYEHAIDNALAVIAGEQGNRVPGSF